MTRLLRAALLAATIALTIPAAASAASAGYILAPGENAVLPFFPMDCDAANLAGTVIYTKNVYRGQTYSYIYWDFYGSPRAVFDQWTRILENRGTVYVRVWCWY
jgi:hypothetical protein